MYGHADKPRIAQREGLCPQPDTLDHDIIDVVGDRAEGQPGQARLVAGAQGVARGLQSRPRRLNPAHQAVEPGDPPKGHGMKAVSRAQQSRHCALARAGGTGQI